MKTIGIKLADGSFYPVLEEGAVQEKTLDLTTAHNNQTRIMVDLYRSDTGKIDNAEYVDTLQIDNLVEHPNGEPDITFTVSLDENNKLSAKIVDTETGAQSKSSITLISRTLEERLVPDSYKISEVDSPEVPPKKSGGLLAAAMSLGNNVPQETQDKENSAGDDTETADFPTPETTDEETPASDITTAADSLPDFDAPTDVFTEEESTDTAADDFSVPDTDEIQDDFSGETSVSEDETLLPDDLPDFDDNEFSAAAENGNGDTPEEKDEADNASVPPKKSGGLLAVAMSLGDNVPQETPDKENSAGNDAETADFPTPETTDEETPASDITTAADSLPDFDAPTDVFTEEESTDTAADDFSVPDTDEIQDDFSGETSVSEDETLLPDDLPDFDDNEFSAAAENGNGDTPEEKSVSDETSALPDFDDTEFTTEGLDLDDISLPEDKSADVQPDNSTDLNYSDDFFNFDDTNTDSAPEANSSAGGISFTGLYDKETEMGDSSDSENIKKKTKTPVIICIICAIICIIATLLVLFIIPSKYNLISSKSHSKTETEITERKTAPEEPAGIPEPEPVPKAKEDEVIVIEEAEDVAPEKPVVIPEETKDIVYKIKWGDTLWDIADTYYKNPWRYHRIARYNNIKDPDYIISGTTINLPAE